MDYQSSSVPVKVQYRLRITGLAGIITVTVTLWFLQLEPVMMMSHMVTTVVS